MSYYEVFQKERYGNILSEQGQPEEENGLTDAEKAIAWSESEYEQQLLEHENR